MSSFTPLKRALCSALLLAVSLVTWQGCGLVTPEQKTPIPDIQKQNKAFFVKQAKRKFVVNKVTGQELSIDAAKGMRLVEYNPTGTLAVTEAVENQGEWHETEKTVQVSRDFQCAWAPVSASGFLSRWYTLHAAPITDHCNVQFKIEENALVGKRVSSTESPRDWETVVTIPISTHYTLEKRRDSEGRYTSDWHENTSEHHWSQRPSMKLNLKDIGIHAWAYDLLDGFGSQAISVEDVEWEEREGKNFLGFTVVVSSPFWGTHLQAKYRFNFLEYEHKTPEKFKPTPFHPDNDNKYFSALHLMGKKFDGVTPGYVAGHWDVSGGDNSVEFCLYGWPEKYVDIAVDVLDEWNDVFERIGRSRPFYLNLDRKLRYPIDLRCPSFVWVQDKRKLGSGVLGIGQNNADVRNGETLWGQVVMYGGLMERYLQYYAPSDFAPSRFGGKRSAGFVQNTGTDPFRFGSRAPFPLGENYIAQVASQHSLVNAKMAIVELELTPDHRIGLEFVENMLAGATGIAAQTDFASQLFDSRFENLESMSEEERASISVDMRAALNDQTARASLIEDLRQSLFDSNSRYEQLRNFAAFKNFVSPVEMEDIISSQASRWQADMGATASAASSEMERFFDERSFQNLLLDEYGDLVSFVDPELKEPKQGNLMDLPEEARAAYLQSLAEQELKARKNSSSYDHDFSFADIMPDVHSIESSIWDRKSPEQRLRSMIKAVFMHEVGHFMGLGHNFEENILPKQGTIPKKHYDRLKAYADKYNSAYSTVMGYSNGRMYVSMNEDEILPGPQDELAVRYLYNREYPLWDGKTEDFTEYREVQSDGVIPSYDFDNSELVTTYFPNCNDFEAILSVSPYCRRFARGYDAKTVVDAYFESFNQNWIAKINNYGGVSRTDAWGVQRYLWARSFEVFNNVRQFYDYMRVEYADEIDRLKNDKGLMEAFHSSCRGMVKEGYEVNEQLRRIFEDNPEFAELCRVNGYAIQEMTKFLEERGPDFPVIDHEDASIPVAIWGGDARPNFARWNGTWKKAGLLPTKLNALITLNTPYPFVYWAWRWMWRIPKYGGFGKDYSFLYSTLYPAEYTEAISSNVRENILIKSKGQESNRIQRSVLAMGNYLWWQKFNNERQRGVDSDYLRAIEDQTKFNLNWRTMGYVVLIFKGKKKTGAGALPNRIKSFQASVYDFGTREFFKLGDAFVLPNSKMIVNSSDEKSLIYPITKMQFYSDTNAYAYGVRVTFDEDDESSLWTRSTKEALRSKYKDVLSSCVKGNEKNGVSNGIAEYFNPGNKDFKGFVAKPTIAISNGRFKEFKESVQSSFDDYLNWEKFEDNKPSLEPCEEAIDGLGTVVMGALAVQGWILPETLYYIEY